MPRRSQTTTAATGFTNSAFGEVRTLMLLGIIAWLFAQLTPGQILSPVDPPRNTSGGNVAPSPRPSNWQTNFLVQSVPPEDHCCQAKKNVLCTLGMPMVANQVAEKATPTIWSETCNG
jgi:hypothetical protein